MVDLREDEQGLTFNVKVKPKSKQNRILGVRAGLLLIAVTAAPEQGKANKAVIEVLADFFDLSNSEIEIISGQTNPKKAVRITGLTGQGFREAVRALEA